MRGPIERRGVDLGAAAQRRGVQLADERLVRIGAAIQQQLDEVQRGQLVGMIGAQPRPVVRAHVGRRVVHVDGEVQRPVVRVGAEVEQRCWRDRTDR